MQGWNNGVRSGEISIESGECLLIQRVLDLSILWCRSDEARRGGALTNKNTIMTPKACRKDPAVLHSWKSDTCMVWRLGFPVLLLYRRGPCSQSGLTLGFHRSGACAQSLSQMVVYLGGASSNWKHLPYCISQTFESSFFRAVLCVYTLLRHQNIDP